MTRPKLRCVYASPSSENHGYTCTITKEACLDPVMDKAMFGDSYITSCREVLTYEHILRRRSS